MQTRKKNIWYQFNYENESASSINRRPWKHLTTRCHCSLPDSWCHLLLSQSTFESKQREQVSKSVGPPLNKQHPGRRRSAHTHLPLVLLFGYGLGEDVHRSPTVQTEEWKVSSGTGTGELTRPVSKEGFPQRHVFTWAWESLCTAASPLWWLQPQTWGLRCCWCRRSSRLASSWWAAAGGQTQWGINVEGL